MDNEGVPVMNRNAPMPTVTFKGTVKLHGTNAGVSFNKDGIHPQKRSSNCSLTKDNAGFAYFVEQNKEWFTENLELLSNYYMHPDTVTLYGEWCGGNIQKGVGICNLPKMFVIFGLKVTKNDEGRWVNHNWAHLRDDLPEGIYNIEQFKTFELDIDFNNPQLSQNKLIEITEAVEAQCPVAGALGAEGIGEGVVWTGEYKGQTHKFKVKGEKHSSSKVKVLAEVDFEKLNSIDKFIDYAVTENRLNQAIEQVFTANNEEPDIKQMGVFIRWVYTDVVKEEIDTMLESGIQPKEIGKAVGNKSRQWFQSYLDKQIMERIK